MKSALPSAGFKTQFADQSFQPVRQRVVSDKVYIPAICNMTMFYNSIIIPS